MLVVISPAKKQDFDFDWSGSSSVPDALGRTEQLVAQLRALEPAGLAALMGVSDALAELNHSRFQQFETPFTPKNARPALLAFKGDVYTGLNGAALGPDELEFASSHLRILSGLYVVLRPLDLIQPYRLEMGTRFATTAGRNLYEFWGDEITERLNRDLDAQGDGVLINLASNEYFMAVRPKLLQGQVITPVFKELRDGRYRIISFSAKRARGMMAAAIIRQRMSSPEALQGFSEDGYKFNPELSGEQELVFTR